MVANPSSIFAARQARLAEALQAAGLHALALVPGASLVYLTGLHYHLVSRPNAALFFTDQPPLFIVPELEAGKAKALPFPARIQTFGEDPRSWPAAFQEAAESAGLAGKRLGLEPTRMRYLEYSLLLDAARGAQFVSAEAAVASLRMRKDDQELAAMRRAATVAQEALKTVLPSIQVGATEKQIAAALTQELLRAGSEPELPFFPIVAAGPNSADPHATPSDRPLQNGDLLIIDWGANVDGYFSDITRTFAVGEVDAELARVVEIVAEANAAGRAAARPGVWAAAIDQAARQVIDAAGYGAYFIHRTGHGLGLEGHEPPYLRGDNQQPLDTGMTFTVEPGIYLPGRGGARIEDDLVVTAAGGESLTDLPRGLTRVG